jgi:hypothetical protein
MEHERRRDRVWKQIINCVYKNGEVRLEDIDVALTCSADHEGSITEILDKYGLDEEDLDEDRLTQRPDGSYEIIVSPDASETTKRSVLNTMTKNRFGFLEKPDAPKGVWYPGPYLQAILRLDDSSLSDGDEDGLRFEIVDSVLNNENLSDEEKTRSLKMVQG